MGYNSKIILVAMVVISATASAQATDDPSRSSTSGPREQLDSIENRYSEARLRFFRELKAAKGNDETELILGQYIAEIDRAAADGMRIAREHSGDSVAVDALHFVVGVEQAGQLSAPRATPLSDEALRILRRDHVRAPGMGEFCEIVGAEPHDPAREALIQAILEGHPSRADRGHACYGLAELRRAQAMEIPILRDNPELLKSFEAIRGRELMARFLANDPVTLHAEADTLLKRVIAEFGDISLPDGNRYKSLADLASAELRGRHDLAIGKSAPVIEGRDHEGKPFRLSDYRGKVVLLTFSGNWCGPCRRLYPEERRLVEHFKGRPFVLLSVSTDEEIVTLRESIASGEITWRCWWDGLQGPISAKWGILTFPSLFLIDGDGVIRAKPGHQSTTIEDDVEALLANIPARPSP